MDLSAKMKFSGVRRLHIGTACRKAIIINLIGIIVFKAGLQNFTKLPVDKDQEESSPFFKYNERQDHQGYGRT